MTSFYTSPDLSTTVTIDEVEGEDRVKLMMAHAGVLLAPDEARRLAAGLCVAAERVDERDVEREHAA